MTQSKWNKKERKPIRLKDYDYTQEGLYFITICTGNRTHYFGNIINGEMKLSEIGIIADILWHDLPNRRKNIELHNFIIMPNHIHGIIEIIHNPSTVDARIDPTETPKYFKIGIDPTDGSAEFKACKSPSEINKKMAAISPKSGSLSRIIGGYKSAVTKHAHRLEFEFEWQSRFHDHIIRNPQAFLRIANYIDNNPKKWEEDSFR